MKVPVIDHWWQTESGWAMASNCMGLEVFPIKPGSPSKAVPGWDIKVLNDANEEVKDGEIGMNQALKAEIEKLKIYVKVLSDLNDKYVEEIAKAKADLHFFIERK